MGFFDPVSFVLGVGVGAGVGGGTVYALRDRLKFQKNAEGEAVTGREAAREFISPQAGSRYGGEIIKFFQSAHLPGEQLKLTDVVVEPRFIRNGSPTLVIEEGEEGILPDADLYRVVPFLHQFPAIYASFNIETIALKDLESGSKHIAILGNAGMGKSTALYLMGLMASGQLSEKDFIDPDAPIFDAAAEDANLPPEVQERRRKEREDVQRRAIEQLRVVQKREGEMEKVEQRDAAVDFERLVPIYAHVRNIDLDPAHYGGTIDPAEPLIRALPNYVNKATSEISPPWLYRMLKDGAALILIDGYDDLLPEERDRYHPWLQALIEFYGDNFMVITGPSTGYDPLVQVGFASVFIRPVNERTTNFLLKKWLGAWGKVGKLPNDAEQRRLAADNRNRTIMDITMKIWATLTGDIKETGRRGYYESFIRKAIGDVPNGVDVAREIAVQWLQSGRIPDVETAQKIATRYLGGEAESDVTADDSKKKKGAVPTSKAENAIRKLAKSDIMTLTPDGGLAFWHPVFAWFLAGEAMRKADQNKLVEIGQRPNWQNAFGFATAVIDLTPLVLQKFQSRPDLLFNNIFSMAEWMADTPSNTQWKQEILKRLGAVLLSPTQFPVIREYALAALVNSRDDTGGVTYLLRQAVRSGNGHIRQLGCLGIGAIGSTEAINDLNPMLEDPVQEVQLAAGLSLGAIGTEESLTGLVNALLEGEENLRKAVAESLASIPGEGHAILHDGITSEDIMVRRACAFGLARIPETWALVALYRTMLEDSQWYVRSAAERAFTQAREPRRAGPRVNPEPNEYQWLVAWAAERGEAVPEGLSGRQTLMRALQEAPVHMRVEAAKALGWLGHAPAVKALYNTLSDREPAVREAAFDALSWMAVRFGRPMPGLT